MSTVDLRCPSCGALARADAPWCTLCHADLRPPASEAPVGAVAALDPLTAPLDQLLAAVDADEADEAAATGLDGPETDPAASASEAQEGDARGPEDFASLDTDVMFALLRGESRDPLLAKYGSRFESRTNRFVFMAAGAGVLAVLFFGVLAIVGLFVG